MSDQSLSDVETLLTGDLRDNDASREYIKYLQELKHENDRLTAENQLLRQQLRLQRENSGLKVASVLQSILSWFDKTSDVDAHNAKGLPRTNDPDYYYLRNSPSDTKQYQSDYKVTSQENIEATKKEHTAEDQVVPTVVLPDSRNQPSDSRGEKLAHKFKHQRSEKSHRVPNDHAFAIHMPKEATCQTGECGGHKPQHSHRATTSTAPPLRKRRDSHPTNPLDTPGTSQFTDIGNPVATSTPTTRVQSAAVRRMVNYQETSKKLRHESEFSEDSPNLIVRGNSLTLMDRDNNPDGKATSLIGHKSGQAFSVADVTVEQLLQNTRPNKRLIAEVAFQLDRRILNYIFAHGRRYNKDKRRFYGYTIQNIPEMIQREAIDPKTGMLDMDRRDSMMYRYNYILHSLRPLGYDVVYHSAFSADVINKYGLLPTPSDKFAAENFSRHGKEFLKEMLRRVAPDYEIKDIIILLECLNLLANDDGKPILNM